MPRRTPKLGKAGKTDVAIDIGRLVVTRLVLQANSGAGKSWAIRRLLEQTYGHVLHIVIDVEDEFYTLREKHDYVLARADGGDCPATPKTAKLLARRIMELEVSTILGISELKAHERHLFVKTFLEALMALPRNLRKPALVVVDEAHLFAPEKTKAESTAAVIDLMTRGRKRGLCGVLATQRISKLHKDALAEANNKLIGRAALDLDKKRSGDELGMHTRDYDQLRTLKPGEFFAFGPAFSDQPVRMMIGEVFTTHPEPGDVVPPVPAAGKKLKKALEELHELPQDAVRQVEDLSAAKKEITALRRELTVTKRQEKGAPPSQRALSAEFKRGWDESYSQYAGELEDSRQRVTALSNIFTDLVLPSSKELQKTVSKQVSDHLDRTAKITQRALALAKAGKSSRRLPKMRVTVEKVSDPAFGGKEATLVHIPSKVKRKLNSEEKREYHENLDQLTAAQKKILDAMAWWLAVGIERPSRRQVAFAAGYTVSGHFNNTLGSLRTAGLVGYPGNGDIELTDEGGKLATMPDQPPGEEELQQLVRKKLNSAQKKIYNVLVQAYPAGVSREELAERTGYTVSGHFNNTLGSLRTLGVADYPGRGSVRASDVLFMESRA